MTNRSFAVAVAALLYAAPTAAQERGTAEIGAFGSYGWFDNSLGLKTAVGGGGRIGVFIDPRWSIEFEMGEMRATRPSGLKDVNVGILSARVTAVPIKSGAFSLLLGAGAGVGTETWFLHSYGLNALLGAKIALSDRAALRFDAQQDWLANYDYKTYQRVSIGLSLYRGFFMRTIHDTVLTPGPVREVTVSRPDSVSAAETARLRRADAELRNLRDSLGRPRPAPPPSSAAALSAMQATVHFATDRSDITPEAKAILDVKVGIFRANPGMRIIILGETDERASDTYNMALGMRRSAAVKAYLVGEGIDGSRIEITSEGERNPVASGRSASAYAQNRRAEFRLLVGSDYLVPPGP